MNELVMKQLVLTRTNFLKEVNGLDKNIVEVQPEGFNNTIQWMIGHVLTVAEQFHFGFPKKSANLPENYIGLFGNGSKPAEWNGEVPSVEVLISQLKDQLDRIKEIPTEQFNVVLEKPFLGLETVGELANMAAFHEANHLGQIHTMARVINNNLAN